MTYRFRCSDSVQPFKDKIKTAWKLKEREKGGYYSPTVFFGLYHINDWLSFLRHRGKRICFWAGSDIKNLSKGYAFSDGDGLKWSKRLRRIPWHWIFKLRSADHIVENQVEQEALLKLGIKSEVLPSFLGDIDDYPVSWTPPKPYGKAKVFLSANPGREEEYGFGLVDQLAKRLPDIEFHLYGVAKPGAIISYGANIIYHGRVSQGQFDAEIKNYHAGLRPNEFDGFSEILVKSILMGQFPISRIYYPYIWHYETEEELAHQLKRLKKMARPNLEARDYWRKNVNRYPWMTQ